MTVEASIRSAPSPGRSLGPDGTGSLSSGWPKRRHMPVDRKQSDGNGNRAHEPVRCAIYTRKSTEEGLEQEFNSLDAQREAGEAYIRSQKQEGWVALPQPYDDGGFTGANMDRPALKRLLADIESGQVNCVV